MGPGWRWFLNLRRFAPLEYRSIVNHVKMDPEPCSPGKRTYLAHGLMFPDSLDRLPLDLISPVARDAHLQQKRAKFIVRGRKGLQNSCVLSLEICSLTRHLKESAANHASPVSVYVSYNIVSILQISEQASYTTFSTHVRHMGKSLLKINLEQFADQDWPNQYMCEYKTAGIIFYSH